MPLAASQEYRRVDARWSPMPDRVWGEKNVPVVSHHGYVLARRSRPGKSKGARWDAASTHVERELKSTAHVCQHGRCQSGGWSSLVCPRGGISGASRGGVSAVAHTLLGPMHAEFACRLERARWPRASCRPSFRWENKKGFCAWGPFKGYILAVSYTHLTLPTIYSV